MVPAGDLYYLLDRAVSPLVVLLLGRDHLILRHWEHVAKALQYAAACFVAAQHLNDSVAYCSTPQKLDS